MKDIEGSIVYAGGMRLAWFFNPYEAEDWACENFFGQWTISPYSTPNESQTTGEFATGYGVFLEDILVAWFCEKQFAEDLVEEFEPGLIIKEFSIVIKEVFTEEQLEKIKKDAEHIRQIINNYKSIEI